MGGRCQRRDVRDGDVCSDRFWLLLVIIVVIIVIVEAYASQKQIFHGVSFPGHCIHEAWDSC
jgi:hypothetical protein